MKAKSWKGERASYSKFRRRNYRSNKYRTRFGADSAKRPEKGTRKRIWVGGHIRAGKKVKGYYRMVSQKA